VKISSKFRILTQHFRLMVTVAEDQAFVMSFGQMPHTIPGFNNEH
jgi:hypothetical protein